MFKQLLLVGVVLSSAPVWAAEYLVKFKSTGYSQMMSMHGFAIKDLNNDADLMKVDIPKANLVNVVAQLYQNGGIEYIVPNFRVHAFTAPLEPQALAAQWHLAKINAEKAWAKAGNRGSRKITVAVIDTGVDYNHPSLVDNMLPGYDFHQDDADPMDTTGAQNPGHGTHCAGIIGATGVQEGGTIGISPEVSIMPIRFLGENGGGDLNNGIKAIDYAISKKVDIISASWGASVSRSQAKPLLEAIERAEKAGVIFIAAAANDGKNNDKTEVYPANANFENFMSVAASGPNDEKPQWSNYGQKMVHIASPGLNIMSTIPNGKYEKMSGTSMATPLVSGLVAFLKAQDPTLTGAQVKAILQTTGAPVSISTQCDCRIDALAATELIVDKKMYMVPAAGTYGVNESFKVQAFNGKGAVGFQSSNEAVLRVSADGSVTTGQEGDATITAVDSQGIKAFSKVFHVGKAGSNPGNPGDPGNPGNPGEGQCPIEDPATCEALCAIMPDAPWCQ
jgi:thermitase